MKLWGGGKHAYYGKTNSRGQRALSKIHKGMGDDDVDMAKAFKAKDDFLTSQKKFIAKLKRKGVI
jgi:hypothetical protein